MADSRRRYESLAGLMIAAGVNAKALLTYMGHTSVAMTLDRYGHLMPGSEAERRKPPRRYLDRSTGARTGAHTR
jgi:integrase